MAELKPLICKRCGGALDPVTLKCSYCGTYHKWDETCENGIIRPNVIVKHSGGIDVLKKKIAITNEALISMPEGVLAEYATKQIRQSIFESLGSHIEIYSESDFPTNQTIVTGILRVVKPGYKF